MLQQFYRNYVVPNKPVIFTDLIQDWPAMKSWQDDAYLCSLVGEHMVRTEQ